MLLSLHYTSLNGSLKFLNQFGGYKVVNHTTTNEVVGNEIVADGVELFNGILTIDYPHIMGNESLMATLADQMISFDDHIVAESVSDLYEHIVALIDTYAFNIDHWLKMDDLDDYLVILLLAKERIADIGLRDLSFFNEPYAER